MDRGEQTLLRNSADFIDRIEGCILGGAIGDALGGFFEGQVAPAVRLDGRPWTISDDTQLTLATCEAIVASRGIVDPELIAARFAAWFAEGRITGIGASTYKALSELAQGGHWAPVGRRGEMAAGNGAAMRVAPLAFVLNTDRIEDRRALRDVGRITHHNEEAYVGALAIAVAIRTAVSGDWTGGDGLLDLVAPRLPDSRVADRIRELGQAKRDATLVELAGRFGQSGWVVESVPLAMCGAERGAQGFEAVLVELVTAGGDTDTIASMAGQIVGALVGRRALPADLFSRLPEIEFITRIAGEFSSELSADNLE